MPPSETRLEKKRGPKPKLTQDIFGHEYVGRQPVLRFELYPEDLPLGAREMLRAIEELGMPEINLAALFSEALREVPAAFWERRLKELTPLEWRLQDALQDEGFRKRVEHLLEER